MNNKRAHGEKTCFWFPLITDLERQNFISDLLYVLHLMNELLRYDEYFLQAVLSRNRRTFAVSE